jgi:hypothetical protein
MRMSPSVRERPREVQGAALRRNPVLHRDAGGPAARAAIVVGDRAMIDEAVMVSPPSCPRRVARITRRIAAVVRVDSAARRELSPLARRGDR